MMGQTTAMRAARIEDAYAEAAVSFHVLLTSFATFVRIVNAPVARPTTTVQLVTVR
jgi:hypothetical protein